MADMDIEYDPDGEFWYCPICSCAVDIDDFECPDCGYKLED